VEQGTLNVRLRHKKTNFGALADPFDVSLSFSDEMIIASTRDLTPADLAQEATLNAEDRVVAALEDGPAYPDEITETTGLAHSTVKNKINVLKKAGVSKRPERLGAKWSRCGWWHRGLALLRRSPLSRPPTQIL
jgi:hypothetical protein